MRKLTASLCLATQFLFGSLATAADESPKDPAISALNQAKDLLVAQKGLIDAQKDLLTSQKGLLDAKFPTISGGKEGTLEFKSGSADNLHAYVQTYRALERAASDVCARVNAARPKGQTVVLMSSEDVKMSGQYMIVRADLEDLESKLQEMTGEGVGAAAGLELYGAALAMTSIANFTKLFRTNRSLYTEEVTIANEELSNLIAPCIWMPVAYPAAQYDASIVSGESEFLKRLRGLNDYRLKINEKIRLHQQTLKEKRTEAEELTLSELTALAARHDKFVEGMAASDEGTKTPNIFYILRGEIVANAVSDAELPILLTTKIAKQGGFSMITSSIWRSDRFYSSGGVVVSYRLASKDALLAAGIVATDSPLMEIHKKP